MFEPDEIQTSISARPFQPLRILATEGRTFEIHHPNLLMVGLHNLSIGQPSKAHPTVYDRLVRVSLTDVVAIEDLPTPLK